MQRWRNRMLGNGMYIYLRAKPLAAGESMSIIVRRRTRETKQLHVYYIQKRTEPTLTGGLRPVARKFSTSPEF